MSRREGSFAVKWQRAHVHETCCAKITKWLSSWVLRWPTLGPMRRLRRAAVPGAAEEHVAWVGGRGKCREGWWRRTCLRQSMRQSFYFATRRDKGQTSARRSQAVFGNTCHNLHADFPVTIGNSRLANRAW